MKRDSSKDCAVSRHELTSLGGLTSRIIKCSLSVKNRRRSGNINGTVGRIDIETSGFALKAHDRGFFIFAENSISEGSNLLMYSSNEISE